MTNLPFKVAELAYHGINRVRRSLYRKGVLKAQRLPRPVISVGNIAIGGAGKTPAVIRIARFLMERGYRVAVLTRGYGRRGAEEGLVTSLDADRFGDEPTLIHRHNIDVIVGVNRYENALRYDYDIYILDDGFQHLQLHRDLDIVIDAPQARFHREGRSALRDADIVLQRKLRPVGHEPLVGKRVFAFAGLADNEQFFAMLRELGIDVVGTREFPDHHRYGAADLASLRKEAQGLPLVTTEKDAVKLADAPDVIAVGAEFVIDEEVLRRIAGMLGAPH